MRPGPRSLRILVTLAVTALAAALGSRLRFDQDVALLLPDSTPELAGATVVMRKMMERLVIDVESPEQPPMAVEDLGAAADQLARSLLSTGDVLSVQASVEAVDALSVMEYLREHAPRLLGAGDLKTIEERVEPAAVKAAVARLARRLQEPDGAHLAAAAASDPLGISDLALAPLATMTAGFREARIAGGRIASKDGRHLLVLAEPAFAATDIGRAKKLMESLEQAVNRLVEQPAFAGVKVRHLGSHRSTLDNARQIQRDVAWTSLIGVVLTTALAFLAFSRVWLALLSLTPGAAGGILALGGYSLFTGSISALVAGFGAVLLGLTIDYAMHGLFRLDQGDGQCKVPALPLVMSATTTAVAFLSLCASSLPVIRDLGVFGAAGIAGAGLFAIFSLPAIPGRAREIRPPRLNLRAWMRRAQSREVTRIALAAIILLSPAAALGTLRLRFDGDVSHLSSLSHEARADEEAITQTWGEAFRLSAVVVPGATLDEALEANDRVASLLDRLKSEGAIRDHASLAGLLPSPSTQAARLEAWRSFWSRSRIQELQLHLEQAIEGTPFRPEAFAPFLAWLESDPPAVRAHDFQGGPMGQLIEERLLRSGDSQLVSTPVFADDWRQIEALRDRLKQEAPAASLLNRAALVRRLGSLVGEEMGKLGGISLGLVFLLSFIWFGRIELAVVIVLPLVLSLVWTLGILGWLGVPITLANAVFVALLFGVATDYSIFLLSSRLERFRSGGECDSETEASVFLCAVTTCLGFGVLTLAGHPVLFSIGATASVAISCASLLTLFLVPALTGALLRFPGPSGTAGLRNIYTGWWVFRVMVGRALGYLLFRRRSLRPEERARAAIDTIRDMSLRIRHDLPIGRRVYSGEDPEKFAAPGIIVANHESMYDIVALLALPVPLQILVKTWVWKAPLMGTMTREAGYILVDDTTPGAMIEAARASLDQGISLLVFPEGTRSRDGKIARFHNGAFAMARELKVKVIPVAMVNTGIVVRRGTWWVGDHNARIAILDPIDPEDFQGEGADRRMAQAARERIREARDRLWPETQGGPNWHRPIAGMYRYLGPVVGHYAASKLKRDPLVKALPELCPGDGDVLLVGCGLGIMTARLAIAQPRRRFRAMDLDQRKLEVAHAALRGSPNVSLILGDVREVDLGSPGAALVVDVLHYWPEEAQRAILERVAAALPTGGRLIFRDGCASKSWRHRCVEAGEKIAGLIGFTRTHGKFCFRTREGWCNLLRDCGFAVEESRPELDCLSNIVLVARKEGLPRTPRPGGQKGIAST